MTRPPEAGAARSAPTRPPEGGRPAPGKPLPAGQPPPGPPAAPGAPGAPAAPGAPGRPPSARNRTSSFTAIELDSLRSWVADLDRKLGIRTYLTLAAALLALACSIVAVVLAVDARDNSASSDDITRLEEQVAALEGAAAVVPPTTTGGGDAAALEQRLTTLEAQVKGLTDARESSDSRIGVIEDDIDDLRSQISELNGGGG
ncbi:MAG TPA: hypothetical protein VFH44_01185 [Solirubrobacterales bacterium]|nr:hypothetical protein [Solirubrobacterales bacterium]